jgi:hypothetical protein
MRPFTESVDYEALLGVAGMHETARSLTEAFTATSQLTTGAFAKLTDSISFVEPPDYGVLFGKLGGELTAGSVLSDASRSVLDGFTASSRLVAEELSAKITDSLSFVEPPGYGALMAEATRIDETTRAMFEGLNSRAAEFAKVTDATHPFFAEPEWMKGLVEAALLASPSGELDEQTDEPVVTSAAQTADAAAALMCVMLLALVCVTQADKKAAGLMSVVLIEAWRATVFSFQALGTLQQKSTTFNGLWMVLSLVLPAMIGPRRRPDDQAE